MDNQQNSIAGINGTTLACAFLQAAHQPVHSANIEADMLAVVQDIQRAWPNVVAARGFDVEGFFHHLGSLVRADANPSVELLHRSVTDLALAYGCAMGVPAAVAEFEKHPLKEIGPALRRAGASESQIDDTRATLCSMLLVANAASGPRPKILQYAGRGSLTAWLRVVALREWKRANQANQRETLVDTSLFDSIANTLDPQRAALKENYGPLFRKAFVASIATLSMHDRLILKQYFIDGLTIDRLAALHKVHRATTARWVASIMETLLAKTKGALGVELGISPQEVESMLRLIRSSLDVSLGVLESPKRR